MLIILEGRYFTVTEEEAREIIGEGYREFAENGTTVYTFGWDNHVPCPTIHANMWKDRCSTYITLSGEHDSFGKIYITVLACINLS